jgi:hypothetical protein
MIGDHFGIFLNLLLFQLYMQDRHKGTLTAVEKSKIIPRVQCMQSTVEVAVEQNHCMI